MQELIQRFESLSDTKRLLVLRRLRAHGWPVPLRLDAGVDTVASQFDLSAETYLDPAIVPLQPEPVATAPRNILLTGCTGFLGTFLLEELLTRGQATIHCIIRASSVEAARKRIDEARALYGLSADYPRDRVVAIPGDLTKRHLGVDSTQYATLAQTIDVIYHNAAMLNFIYGYDAFISSNVVGTQEILRLACTGRTKALHYVSTVFFFNLGDHLRHGRASIPEANTLDLGRYCFGGYSQSKWVAEKMVETARNRGLPATVYRPGMIMGHSRTGAIHNGEIFVRLTQGAVQMGFAPVSSAMMFGAPVDFVAQAIVCLSGLEAATNQTFHTIAAEPAPIFAIDSLHAMQHEVESVSMQEWAKRVEGGAAAGTVVEPLLPFLAATWPGASPNILDIMAQGPRIECGALQQALAGRVECPSMAEAVAVSLQRLHESGALSQPATARHFG